MLELRSQRSIWAHCRLHGVLKIPEVHHRPARVHPVRRTLRFCPCAQEYKQCAQIVGLCPDAGPRMPVLLPTSLVHAVSSEYRLVICVVCHPGLLQVDPVTGIALVVLCVVRGPPLPCPTP